MHRSIRLFSVLAGLLLLSPLLQAGPVAPRPVADELPLQLVARQGVSLEQAVRQVKRQTGGRILTAETVVENGRRVHRIKVLLPNGHVKVRYIEAD